MEINSRSRMKKNRREGISENLGRHARPCFFQSNVTKLFDLEETIVVLSGSAVATGGDKPCQRLGAMCLRDLCACNQSVRVRAKGRQGGQHSPHLVTLFARQRCDPREYITLEVVSALLSDVADLFPLARMCSVSRPPARFLARRWSREPFPRSRARGQMGDTLYTGARK